MKKKNLYYIFIFILSIYSLFFIIGSALAPILAHYGYYYISAKVHFTYMGVCHQNPTLCFWVLGYPMSLCCRCFGTYIGCFSGCVLAYKKKLNNYGLLLLIPALLDIYINNFFKFNTGKQIRFISGICLGIALISILQYSFKERK